MQKLLFTAAALVILSLPAFAQTVEQDGANDRYGIKTERAERVFLKYHRSIRAEESCNGRKFSDGDRVAMETTIGQRMQANSPDVAVGAARLLTLRPIADNQMDDMIDDQGCDGADVKKALQFFDDHLASAALPPEPATEVAPVTDAPQQDDAPQSLTKSGQ